MKRADLDALAGRYELDRTAVVALERLLEALAHEPAPPTTVAEPGAALEVHVADSLSGLEVPSLVAAERIADLGSGAGFPGLPLAIALPHARVDLIEATRSKCEVIERLAAAGRAANARAIPVRAEDWAPPPNAGDADLEPASQSSRGAYQAVTARALATLAVLAEYAAPLLAPGGVLVAWKGARRPAEECAGAAAAAQLGLELDDLRHVTPYAGAREHHLHIYRKVAETPERFPRRAGIAAKRPLG